MPSRTAGSARSAHSAWSSTDRCRPRRACPSRERAPSEEVLGWDEGQTTAEYALVLLGAAAMAMLLFAWASRTKAIGRLLDAVLDSIIGRIT
ncbi:MAG: hypothetical protein KatS3mg008_1533 [Acidimicrobiales bacterium]|nr:MAG: hypothetical protein KatS3mg008_1533 [Acidimicrobiales bacterium]